MRSCRRGTFCYTYSMSSNHRLSLIICILLILTGLLILSRNTRSRPTVVLGGRLFSVEIADTPALQQKGLSGHAPLNDREGMLFVFSRPDRYGFWMKDMLFPLDIIWIGSDWRITHIEHSLATSTYPAVFYPEAPSRYVLEISSGLSDTLGLKTGDIVKFSKN